MSQKELNYMEDIYNHECLIISILNDTIERIDDDSYAELFEDQIEKHTDLINKISKVLEGCCNE